MIKYWLDFLFALILIIILLPLIMLLMLLLLVYNNGSPFFVHPRIGENGIVFNLYKFKTMTDNYDQDGQLLPDSKRITSIGKFMRKASLDELPQLINVLKGEMSIIGPRPLLPEYLQLYSQFQNRRHEVRPGITGWAQVNGRNTINWKQKFDYDIWYVDNLTFLLDLQILLLTLKKVVKREGINQDSGITMEKFKGN